MHKKSAFIWLPYEVVDGVVIGVENKQFPAGLRFPTDLMPKIELASVSLPTQDTDTFWVSFYFDGLVEGSIKSWMLGWPDMFPITLPGDGELLISGNRMQQVDSMTWWSYKIWGSVGNLGFVIAAVFWSKMSSPNGLPFTSEHSKVGSRAGDDLSVHMNGVLEWIIGFLPNDSAKSEGPVGVK